MANAIYIPIIKGDKGEKGDTPVNGVDYFTETEKQTFKEDVRDELEEEFQEEINENIELSKDIQVRQTRLEEKYDAQIRELANENPQLPEIVDARGGFDTLGERLEKTDDKISSNIKVHFIYRGTNKGDCSLIETKGKNILIDVGNETNASELINYLVTNHITKIDFIIISHYHSDHIGGVNATGLRAILESSALDCSNCVFYLPPNVDYTQFIGTEKTTIQGSENTVKALVTEKNLTYVQPINLQELTIDDFTKLKFLNCDTSDYADYYNITVNELGVEAGRTAYNNFSLVTELQHLDNKFLFTGDIESKAQEKICPYMSTYDVLKVEHHGTSIPFYEDYFRKLSPKIAVVMNTWGDITKRSSTSYLKEKSEFYTSNESGNVIVNSDGKNVHAISTNGKYNKEIPSDTYFKINKITGVNILSAPINLINENDNLNDYKTPGTYWGQLEIVDTFLNCPTDTHFKLIVEQITGLARYLQTIICNTDKIEIYHRIYNAGGWTNWELVGHQKTSKLLYSGSMSAGDTVSISGIKDFLKFRIIPTEGVTSTLGLLNNGEGGIRGLGGLPETLSGGGSKMTFYGVNLSIGSQNADGSYNVTLNNFIQFIINPDGGIYSTPLSIKYIYGII